MNDKNITISYVNKGMYCRQMLVQFSPLPFVYLPKQLFYISDLSSIFMRLCTCECK